MVMPYPPLNPAVGSPYGMPQAPAAPAAPTAAPPWGLQPMGGQQQPQPFDFKTNPMVTALASSLLANRGAFGPAMESFGQQMPAIEQTQNLRNAWNRVLIAKSKGEPIPQADQALIMQSNPVIGAKFFESQMGYGTPRNRVIKNDPNGVARYADTGEEVFPGVHKDVGPEGIFSGKSVMGQGLNYLISTGKITNEQAATLAASKPVIGADGTVYLATPEGIFANGQPAVAPTDPNAPVDPNAPADSQAAPPLGGAPPGMIPLTGSKTYGTQDQTTAAGFARRMIQSDAIISDPKIGAEGTNWWQMARSQAPLGLCNMMISDKYRQLDQAQRNFLNATLRRESGAAISDSEFENGRRQYFPQPGDDQKTLDQKKANRESVIQSLTRSAGPLNQGFVKTAVPDPAAAAPADAAPADPLGIR